jgi:hypothetical protein
MQKYKEEISLARYRIPIISSDSVYISVMAKSIDHADFILSCGMRGLMGITTWVNPENSDVDSSHVKGNVDAIEAASDTLKTWNLDFFKGLPFRAGLIKGAMVDIYTTDTNVPVLVLNSISRQDEISWPVDNKPNLDKVYRDQSPDDDNYIVEYYSNPMLIRILD